MSKLILNQNIHLRKIKSRIYDVHVPVIGLTGGLASGKSTVTKIITNLGLPVIEADKLIHQIYKSNSVKKEISRLCPGSIRKKNTIDFAQLRKWAFLSKKNLSKLEKLLYPHLEKKFKQSLKKSKNCNFIFYDVPLLFEKKLQNKFDYIVLVYSPYKTQLRRVVKRDKIKIELAKKMLRTQFPISKKINKSDYILKNDSDLKQLKSNVKKFLSTHFKQVA